MNVCWVHTLHIIGANWWGTILIPLNQLFVEGCPKAEVNPAAVILPFHLINGHIRFNDHAGLVLILLINAWRGHMPLRFYGII